VRGNPCLREKVHICLGSLHVADFIYCLCDGFFFVRLSKMLRVYVLDKVKTIFYFLWSLILTALFGHQPTYKNLRGYTDEQ